MPDLVRSVAAEAIVVLESTSKLNKFAEVLYVPAVEDSVIVISNLKRSVRSSASAVSSPAAA